LIEWCYEAHPDLDLLLIDRHFNVAERRDRFDRIIRARLGTSIAIEHADSIQDPRVDLADHLAGAVRYYCLRGDDTFRQLVAERIVREERRVWRKQKK
jgi:hypothetical protein